MVSTCFHTYSFCIHCWWVIYRSSHPFPIPMTVEMSQRLFVAQTQRRQEVPLKQTRYVFAYLSFSYYFDPQ